MISESLARVHRDFDNFLEEKVGLNWDEQRRKIYEHFGLAPRDETQGSTATGAFGRTTKRDNQQGRPAASAGTRSVFGRSGLEKSVIGSPGNGFSKSSIFADGASRTDSNYAQSPDTLFLREKMGFFADKVQRLNFARLQNCPFPVLHELADVEDHAGGDVSLLLGTVLLLSANVAALPTRFHVNYVKHIVL